MDSPVIFLNSNQVRSKSLAGKKLPEGYVLACRFLRCGIIDRTATLDQGFDYRPLDPIPSPMREENQTFAELCDAEAETLVAQALEQNRRLHVLWSGGIDSTAALIAIMKAVEARNCREVVEVMLSIDSIHEYVQFYLNWIKDKYQTRPITHPIADHLNPNHITVTGEHGDQLFGIYLLKPYVKGGSAHLDYQDVLPYVLTRHLNKAKRAERVMRYLEPQIAAAPVPIKSLFDCMWWLGYSLKWQQVTLRLPVFRNEQVQETYQSVHHFFRAVSFQAWALATPTTRLIFQWEQYKDAAKQYILDFTSDVNYYRDKQKELSLKNMIVRPEFRTAYRAQVYMREDFQPIFEIVERTDSPKGHTIQF